jgi:hypothetical protein
LSRVLPQGWARGHEYITPVVDVGVGVGMHTLPCHQVLGARRHTMAPYSCWTGLLNSQTGVHIAPEIPKYLLICISSLISCLSALGLLDSARLSARLVRLDSLGSAHSTQLARLSTLDSRLWANSARLGLGVGLSWPIISESDKESEENVLRLLKIAPGIFHKCRL